MTIDLTPALQSVDNGKLYLGHVGIVVTPTVAAYVPIAS